MYYGFKPNPKQLVIDKAKRLFGRDVKVAVTGTRPGATDSKKLGIVAGTYYVECFINDKLVAVASTKNWRKAYSLLAIEVEKAYENSLYVP